MPNLRKLPWSVVTPPTKLRGSRDALHLPQISPQVEIGRLLGHGWGGVEEKVKIELRNIVMSLLMPTRYIRK
jgi:hypothetical protein